MSDTIDTKIVEMKFDNSNFEKNVSQTMNSVDKLEKKLDTTNKQLAFENLQKSLDGISTEKINKALDSVIDKFSTVGTIWDQTLRNITTSIENKLASTVNSVISVIPNAINGAISQIKTGGISRATNIENARFMLQGLFGDEKKVAAIMENAQESVTDTAYGYDQAALAASQFAASGVEAGDEMLRALSAVAGTASTTNQEYSGIAHLFTQIVGQGKAMSMQLSQFSNRGINAAALMADYYNRVGYVTNNMGEKLTGTIDIGTKKNPYVVEIGNLTEADVREMASQSLIVADDFLDAFSEKFGDHAKDANQTFNGIVANVKAALSRIGAKFVTPIISQNSNVVKLLNTVKQILNSFNSILDPLVEKTTGWILHLADLLNGFLSRFVKDTKDATTEGSKWWAKFSEGFYAIVKLFRAIGWFIYGIFDKIRIAWLDIFPIKPFNKVIDKIKDFSNIMYGLNMRTDENREAFKEIFRFIFSALKVVIELLKGAWTIVKPIFSAIGRIGASLMRFFSTIAGGLKDFNLWISDGKIVSAAEWLADKLDWVLHKVTDGIDWALDKLGKVVKIVRDVIGNIWGGLTEKKTEETKNGVEEIGEEAEKVLTPLQKFSNFIKKIFTGIWNFLNNVFSGIKAIFTNLFSSIRKDSDEEASVLETFWNKIVEIFKKVKNVLTPIIEFIKATFKGFGEALKEFFSKSSFNKGASDYVNSTKKTTENAKSILINLLDFFKGIASALKWVVETISSLFGAIGRAISKFFEKHNYSGEEIFDKFFTNLSKVLKEVWEVAVPLISAIWSVIKPVLKAIADVIKSFGTTISEFLTEHNFFDLLKEVFSIVQQIADIFLKGSIGTGIASTGMGLMNFGKGVKETGKGLKNLAEGGKTFLTAFSSIGSQTGGVIGSFRGILDAFKEGIEITTGKKGMLEKFKEGSEIIKNFALSVLMIAAALAMLALVDTGKLYAATGALAIIIGLLTGLLFILQKFGSSTDDKKGLSWSKGKGLSIDLTKSGNMPGVGTLIGIAIVVLAFARIVSKFVDLMNQEGGVDKFKMAVGALIVLVVLMVATVKILQLDFDKLKETDNGMFSISNNGKNMPGLSTMLGLAKYLSIMSKVIMRFANMDSKSLWSGVGAVSVMVGILIAFLAVMKLLMGTISYTSDSLTETTESVKNKKFNIISPNGSKDFEKLIAALYSFAIIIRTLAYVVTMLGNMNPDKLKAGMGSFITLSAVITTILVVISLLIKYLEKNGIDDLSDASSKISSMAKIITAMGLAMILMAVAMKIMSSVPIEYVAGAIAAMLALVAVVSILAYASTTIDEADTKKILVMVGAMYLIVGAIAVLGFAMKSFNGVSFGDVLAAFGSVIVMLVAFGAACVAFKHLNVDTTFLIIASAMLIISAAIYVLALAMERLQYTIVPFLIQLTVATDLLKNLILKWIMFIPELLGGLIKALVQTLVDSVDSIIEGVVTMIHAACQGILQSAGELVDTVLKLILMVLQKVSENIGPILDYVLDILATFFQKLRVRLPEIAADIGATIKDLIELMIDLLGINSVEDFFAVAGKLTAIAVLLPEIDAILVELAVTGGLMAALGAELTAFAENSVGFFNLTSSLPKTAFTNGALCVDLILKLTEAELLDAISKWLGGTASIDSFGEQLVSFGKSMREYALEVAGIDTKSIEASAAAGGMLVELARNVPNEGGLVTLFTGGNNLDKFSTYLPIFAEAMVNYNRIITRGDGIDAQAVTASACAGKIIADMAKSLPNEGGVLGFFAGENNLDRFAEQIVPFAEAIVTYCDTIAGHTIDTAAVTASANAGKIIAEMAKTLPNEGGVLGFFVGENNLDKFSTYIVPYAEAISSYCDIISQHTIDTQAVEASANAGKMIAEMAKTLPNEGGFISWIVGDNSLGKHAEDLKAYGEAMKEFSGSISGYKAETVQLATSTAKTLASLAKELPSTGGIKSWFTGGINYKDFAINLPLFGAGIKGFSDALSGGQTNLSFKTTSSKDAAEAVKVISQAVSELPASGGLKSWLSGDIDYKKFADSMGPLGEGVKKFSDAITGTDGKIKFDTSNVEPAVAAIKTILGICEVLPEKDVISTKIKYGIFSGVDIETVKTEFTSFKDIADQLPLLGSGLKDFQANLGEGFDPDFVQKAARNLSSLITSVIPIVKTSFNEMSGFYENTNDWSILDNDTFVNRIANLGNAIGGFYNSMVTKMGTDTLSKFNDSGYDLHVAADDLGIILKSLADIDLSKFDDDKFGKFSDAMPNIGKNLANFFTSFTILEPVYDSKTYSTSYTKKNLLDNIERYKAVAEVIVTLAAATNDISNNSGIFKSELDSLPTVSIFDQFLDSLPNIGSKLSEFMKNIDIPEVIDKITGNVTSKWGAIKDIVDYIPTMASNLSSDSITKYNSADALKVAQDMPTIAGYMKDFISSLTGVVINYDTNEMVTEATSFLDTFIANKDNMGSAIDFIADMPNKFSAFNDIVSSDKIKNWFTDIGGVFTELIEKIGKEEIQADIVNVKRHIQWLANVASQLDSVEKIESITGFLTAMKDAGGNGLDSFASAFDVESDQYKNLMDRLEIVLDNVLNLFKKQETLDDWKNAGSILIKSLVDGFGANSINGNQSVAEALAGIVINALNAVKTKEISYNGITITVQNKAEDLGRFIVDGITMGLNDKDANSKLWAAARKVISEALIRMDDEAGIASPSKETYKRGRLMLAGLINALIDGGSNVYNAAGDVSQLAVDGISDTIASVYTALGEYVDDTITITPVLDLSEVAYGAGVIGNMLDSDNYGLLNTSYYSARAISDSENELRRARFEAQSAEAGKIQNDESNTTFNNSFNISGAQDPKKVATEVSRIIYNQRNQRSRSMG